jgi:ribosomal protein S3
LRCPCHACAYGGPYSLPHSVDNCPNYYLQIIIRATHTQEVLGEKGRRIRELTALVQKRFKFPENTLELYAEKVQTRGLSAVAQCESLRYKLLGGLAIRR